MMLIARNIMVAGLTATLLGAGPAAAQASAPATEPAGRSLFISPMGEPFRGDNRKELVRVWFDRADANRDGALSLAEMRGDAERFFAVLNVNKDREIDPSELRDYEQRIAPEIKVGFASLVERAGPANPDARKPKLDTIRRGAGVHGLLATPNPVASADTNFNRGISSEEFARAARDRFVMLDSNRDGQVRFEELPAIPSRF